MYKVTNTSDTAAIKIASNPVVEIPCGGSVEMKEATAKFLVERYPWLTMEPVEPKKVVKEETPKEEEKEAEEPKLEEPKVEKKKKSKK